MDIKAMLIDMASAQAEKLEGDMISKLNSKEMEEMIASKINEKIDIPFVSEDKEQIFFEKCVDVVTDLLEGFIKGKS